ncbi:MAG TPA: Ig-like domain-containing protein [Candidatus Limnocylindria bacterium]|nr:Ig-like domain-containing protein [Candidatus Limnocylindria bacterium]
MKRFGIVLALALALVFPTDALAATAGAPSATKAGQPFPTNLYTVRDEAQITGLRVDLPKPDCPTHPSDCADIDVLDTLDGFNIQPRISIPFSAPIDLSTVSSSTVFLVGPQGHVVGINQAVWEPLTNTLHLESDEQLAQDTTYLFVVTRGVRGADGKPLEETDFRHDLNFGQTKDPHTKAYRKELLEALPMAMAGGATPNEIAAASLFTTQSIDAISRQIRSQLTAGAASFTLGAAGERTVFPLSSVAGIQLRRQTGTTTFSTSVLPTPALSIFPGSVGAIAFGSYASPNYENEAGVIPATGTKEGTPVPQSTRQIQFTLFLPAGATPEGGWPTAIFGHGFGDSKDGAPWVVASSLAHAGIATIAINVVGHGGGALGTYTVLRTAGAPVTLPSGGRGIDQDGDGTIASTEGVSAVGAQSLIGSRDGLRQTTIDLMQLVKVVEGGFDVDGDGSPALSGSRIYYAGQSFGGIYGLQLVGLEPDIHAGVLNVPGGPIIEIARLSPSFRPLVGISLITRTPSLYNAVPNPPFFTSFVENIPLRNRPLLVDTVPGASAIQALLDNTAWAQQAANPAAYAPFISQPVIIQFARGDKTVPNPTATAILRAGQLASRATLFRNDLAFAANPAVPKNPHTFLTNITGPGAPYALAAQRQIATFFASDGAITIDPDGPGPFFETPTSMLPEDLAFIP